MLKNTRFLDYARNDALSMHLFHRVRHAELVEASRPRCLGALSQLTAGRFRAGFTLIEMLIAIALLSAVTVVVFMSFSVVSGARNKMIALSDNMHHGDYVMDQLYMALRSSYMPDRKGSPLFGFRMENEGFADAADDKISWVKMGTAIVGKECSFAGTPHRTEILLDQDEDGESGIYFKSWPLNGLPDDFDPLTVEPVLLSKRVTGFNIRTMLKMKTDGTPDWEDKWEDTNRIPAAVEITLYLSPLEKDGEPVEIKKICPIPCGNILSGK
jgi:prepilin-type N-terminal cleavage/methylation domain-containing protein